MLFDMKFIHKGLTCLISVFVSSAAPSATLTSPIFPFVLIHSLTAVLREVKCFGNQSSFMHGFSIMRTLGILSEAKKKKERSKDTSFVCKLSLGIRMRNEGSRNEANRMHVWNRVQRVDVNIFKKEITRKVTNYNIFKRHQGG